MGGNLNGAVPGDLTVVESNSILSDQLVEDLLHQQTVATYPLDDRLRRPLHIRISNGRGRVVFSYRNDLVPLPGNVHDSDGNDDSDDDVPELE